MPPRSFFLAPLLVVACSPVTPQPGGSANYSASLGEGPDFSEPHGLIVVETWLRYGENQLSGAFADGPGLHHHSESERSGSCRLMTYTASTCEPGCSGDELCIDGVCQAWPTRIDRGDLLWSWPDGEQTVSPDATLGYWATGSASSEGEVSIAVEGLDLSAPTIAAMEPDGDWERALSDRDGDAVLRWKNPILDARVRLFMTDCTGTHGGLAAAEVECEGPDTGELIIPDAYLAALEAGDWSHGECGGHELERYHAATSEGDTSVRLETVSDGGLFWRPDW
jgi:hypothetical protein